MRRFNFKSRKLLHKKVVYKLTYLNSSVSCDTDIAGYLQPVT